MSVYSRVLVGISAAFALLSFGYLSIHSFLFKHTFAGDRMSVNTNHDDRVVSQGDPKQQSGKVAYVGCGGFLN